MNDPGDSRQGTNPRGVTPSSDHFGGILNKFLKNLDLLIMLRVVGTSYSSRGSQPEGSSRPGRGRGLEMTICIPWLWLEAVQLWFCSKAHECGLLIRLIITSF
jgi:hypothetical protein